MPRIKRRRRPHGCALGGSPPSSAPLWQLALQRGILGPLPGYLLTYGRFHRLSRRRTIATFMQEEVYSIRDLAVLDPRMTVL